MQPGLELQSVCIQFSSQGRFTVPKENPFKEKLKLVSILNQSWSNKFKHLAKKLASPLFGKQCVCSDDIFFPDGKSFIHV